MREVNSADWLTTHEELLAYGFVRFEYLTAAHIEAEKFEVFSKVTSALGEKSVLVKTLVAGELQSISHVYYAAEFHERELHQMFGIEIAGRPNIENAFATEFAGYPLRRDFALQTRKNTAWPGAVEPDEKARRRPALPPGVHESWSN